MTRPRQRPRAARPIGGKVTWRDPARAETVLRRLTAEPLQRAAFNRLARRFLPLCAASADPDRVLVNFERLVAALPNASMFYHYLEATPACLALLVKVFAHSQALTDTLMRDAKFFHFLIAPEMLVRPRAKAWLDVELRRSLLALRAAADRYGAVRQFRRRETLRIGARDLMGLATVEETTGELANLADVCLQMVFEIALESLCRQTRLPVAARAAAGRFTILGMGKLGGQELNYSSDVDVIFVYAEEGEFTPRLSYHEFYTKLAEEICRVVGGKSAEGSIFRIDLRLRPEGATGPLVRSLESCENYYAEWGETWERMALIKARPVAGDPTVGAAFLQMVQPFIFARNIGENVIRQMGALKKRIEQEIVHDDRLTRHVKLGIGGIREIEFIVQSFQILRGSRLPAVRERSTLPALVKLAQAGILTDTEAATLATAYRFMRNVEHRLQMELELQTHTIPDETEALYRLARSMDFRDVPAFQAEQARQMGAVRAIYGRVLAGAEAPASARPESLEQQLAAAGFEDVPAAVKRVRELWEGPGFVHLSQRTRDAFGRLFPLVLRQAKQAANPDAALAMFAEFVSAYGSRGLLYELLGRNPKLVEIVLRLGDASRFLAAALVRQPDLFDEVCRGVSLSEPKSRERMWTELQAGRGADPAEVARQWKQAELVRIGIEDVLGLLDLEHVQQELTWLAETCLRFALETAGSGTGRGLAVIGMGKFGGQELGYGADLDVLFVTDGNDARGIKLAAAVMGFMERQTGSGSLFKVDPRLRPDGEKGPLAADVGAHQEYYARRAQLWERQALTKARFVAGDEKIGRAFMQMVEQVVYGASLEKAGLVEIARMRRRIETERVDKVHATLEFKTGPGGLMDVEFAVQALQLRHGCRYPQLRTAHTLAALNRLAAAGLVEDRQSYVLRSGYLFLRRIESALRRWDGSSVSRLPVEPAEQGRLAKRLGYGEAAQFLAAYQAARTNIRRVYDELMG